MKSAVFCGHTEVFSFGFLFGSSPQIAEIPFLFWATIFTKHLNCTFSNKFGVFLCVFVCLLVWGFFLSFFSIQNSSKNSKQAKSQKILWDIVMFAIMLLVTLIHRRQQKYDLQESKTSEAKFIKSLSGRAKGSF